MQEEKTLRKKLIHEVMLMAYHEGIEEGKKQALETIRAKSSQMPSHNPQPNSYGRTIKLGDMPEPFVTVDDIPEEDD